MVFSPPPRVCVPYLGYILSPGYDELKQRKKEHYMDELARLIITELKPLSPNYLSIITVPWLDDVRPFQWNNFKIDLNYTYHIPLDRSLDEIWKSFSKDSRQRVRAFEERAPKMRESNDIDTFYQLLEETYRRQGLSSPIISKEYLRAIISKFPEEIKLYYVYIGDEIMDAELVYVYKNSFKLWLGGMAIRHGVNGGQEYATWQLIKNARSAQYKDFEIIGANTKRLCEYQSKFNPSLKTYIKISQKDTEGMIAEFLYKKMIMKTNPITKNHILKPISSPI